FFQAEDGIRDLIVTGVQTCALPILRVVTVAGGRGAIGWIGHHSHLYGHLTVRENLLFWASLYGVPPSARDANAAATMRRVGVAEIGRASCRERGEVCGVAGRARKKQ